MKPQCILIVVAAILLSLVLVQGVQAETYIWAGGWGTLGNGNYEFTSPEGIAVNGSEVYVADSGNSRILKFTMDGSYLTQWGSNGTGDGQFTTPHSIAADSNGNVYVADPIPARIQKFNSGGTYLTQWGYPTYNYMQWPAGVAVNSTGYVFDAEGYDSPQIVVFTSTGTRVDGWTTPSGGSGYPTTHTRPRGVAVGSSGNVYVVSYSNNLIQKFSPDGTYTTYWGGTQGSGNGEFNSPQGIAIDSNENVYVADTGNNRIQKFDSNGLYLTQWGTSGTGDGQFNSPQGVAVDSNENVYVADTGNNRIQKFATLDVTGCRRIDTPGSYILKNDILNSNIAKCIEILSSDVSFDGNKYTIDGTDTGSSYGFYVYNVSKRLQNINIRNVTLTDWYCGAEFWNVNSSRIENTTASNNSLGIYLTTGSYYNNLVNNNASYNTWIGYSVDGQYSNLNHNTARGNGNYGISIGSPHNIVTDNAIADFFYMGILLADSGDNIVANNSITGTGTWGGLYLFNTGTQDNTIVNNSISRCNYPIYIDRASNNTIFNNYFNNTNDGVYFFTPVSNNTWNTTKTAGTNIIGGSWLGGNYWGNTSSTGYSQTCTNAGDGICNVPYTITSGNIDNLPLTNNAAATSISYGSYVNGTISTPSTWDNYAFNGAAGDPVYIRLKTSWWTYGQFKLYAPNGTLLASPSGYDGTELSTTLSDTGTYTLLAGDLEGDNTGTFDLYLQRTKNPAGPILISYGDYVNGSIDHRALYETYTFSGTAGDPIYIRLKTSWWTYGQFRLYAPNGTLLASPSDYDGTELSTTLMDTGTYTLLAGDLEGDNTGTFDLYLQRTKNPAGPILISYGDYVNGSIVHRALYETYTFSGTAGDPIYIRLKTSWWTYGQFRLYAPNGTLLASPSGYDGTELSTTLSDTGTYTLLAGDLEGDNTGTFDLYLQRTKNPAGPILISYGDYVNGSIDHRALYETYTFSGTVGDPVYIRLNTSWWTYGQFRLYAPNGTLLASPSGYDGTELSTTLSDTGTYTLLAGDLEGDNTGTFDLYLQHEGVWDGTTCTVITTPGTYRMLGDIQGTPGITCIEIRSSDVNFEGNGYTLNGTLDNLGMRISASPAVISNVSVRNLTISNWDSGIDYENVTGGAIDNTTVLFSETMGVTLGTSSSVVLTNVNASLNWVGIGVIEGSDYNTLTHVTASRNDAVGLWFYAARNNEVKSGTFDQNNGPGVSLDGQSNNNTLSGNTANFNSHGIFIEANGNGFPSSYPVGPSNNNTIVGNIARNNTESGLYLVESANNNRITGNTFTNNRIGVHFNATAGSISGNIISNNNASSNNYDGILFSNATGNTLTANNVTANGNNGIYLFNKSRGNFLSDNIAALNGIDGFVVKTSRYNNLTNNKALENVHIGINLDTAENSTVLNNLISENDHGILLYFASNNTIVNNSISANNEGFRILITGNNTITSNTVTVNDIGIWVNSSYNDVFNNYFENTNNAVDSSTAGNRWNTTRIAGTNIIGGSWIGGNYWSDYIGVDTDGDGLGDTLVPYTAGGNIAAGGDWIPLTSPSHAAPAANFIATSPTSGTAPLIVSFSDLSLNDPEGWAWFFGDENYSQAWTKQTASAGWSARTYHSSVTMPDGSILLMGGTDTGMISYNETWRSVDNGLTWELVNGSSGWSARWSPTSVAMPDGSIVLMGGENGIGTYYMNDTWRSTDKGETWTQLTASPGWSARKGHNTVAMPDGSILLMGGYDHVYFYNDTWRSVDNGSTWELVNGSSGWSGRMAHSSVVMPDGTIVLMGGVSGFSSDVKNDVWRSTNNGVTWTQVNASAGWSARQTHSSVVMPDGSIVLTGGYDAIGPRKNDTWRSKDNGVTWTQLPDAGWTARDSHSSVAMPDGSIVLMGGYDGIVKSDVWRIMPAGSSEQNPSHTYTMPGNYSVALQVFNAGGYNSTRKAGYITVTGQSNIVNGTIIQQDATIFIGEGGLNITPALTQANEQTGTTGLTLIGWWASPEDVTILLPTVTNETAGIADSFLADPGLFVGYTGVWYLVKADGTGGAPVFEIQDPSLSLNIWDFYMDADVTGYAVTYGEKLGFRVNTNMYPSVNMTQRSPLDPANDGYIDIKVKDPNGAEYTTLLNDSVGTPASGPNSLLANFVDAPAWYWGGFDSYGWQTAALDSGGSLYYPSGTYSVYAESTLHGMKDNYKNGGADYTTKTISPTVTFELVNHAVKIESDKDTVVRGESFSVTVTGKGRTIYHVWVTNTSDLAGGPDGHPPMVNSVQAGVQYVPVLGSADAQRADAVATELSALGYAYANASAGRVVFDDVAHSADTGYGTRTGFNIVTSVPGNRTVEFVTTNWTKAQRYTIHVEQNFGSESSPSFKIDEVDVNVEAGTAPVANFTANVTYGAAPLIVQFTDTSMGSPTEWNWSFGDDTFSASQNPIHTYNTAGVYTVILNASNAGGYNITQKTGYISVAGSPEPGFITLSVTPMIGPVGTVFHFSGANTFGDSPAYYTNIFVVNNTVLTPGGSLPVNGVRPDDFSIETISGDNSTIYQAPVVGGGWYYDWDTSDITGGSLLPGSLYTIFVVNETRNVSTLSYGSYTKAQVAIEGPVEADYIVNTSYGINPLTVQFIDISTGIPTTVNLSFGDGTWTNSTGSWVHTYTNEGTFFPIIYASNSISSDSGTNATISVNVTSGLEKSLAEAYNVVLANETILDGTSEGTAVSAVTEKFDAGIKSVDVWGGKPALDLPEEPGWLIFIDDYPGANWEHPCRYVFVDDEGKTTVIEAMSPPLNIDTDQIAGETSDPWGDTNSVNSLSPNPGGGLGTLSLVPECSNPDCSHNYALLISGGFNASQNHIRYWNDISFMYQTLNQTYGYPADHITILMSDGTSPTADRHNATVNGVIKTDNSPVNLDNKPTTTEVIRDATRTTLESTLTSLRTGGSKALGSTDSLFIFTTSHGGIDTVPGVNNSILYLWNKEYINDTEFVSKLPTQCKNITLVMEQCYSGGFVDNFIDRYTGTSQGRVIATAASSTEPSWGNGFSNAWTSGVARIDDRLNPNDAADTNGDNHISMAEAFNYAAKADPSANPSLANHEHPQYKAKNPVNAGTTRFLNSCPVPVAKSIRVTRPNTAESWKQKSTYYITWTESGLSTVNISLWKANAFNRYIAQVPASPSGYLWTVPTLTIASDYYINISSVGTSPILIDRSDTNFAIAASGATGYLWVNTSPVTGATIYIDGVVNGATNKKLTLNNGDHNVTVTRSGYYSMQSTATVKSSQTAVANFILTEIQTNDPEDTSPFGSITIDSNVPGAEVFIDEKDTGLTTPAAITEIWAGEHDVYVTSYGYEIPQAQTVYVPRHTSVNAYIELTLGTSNVPPLVNAGDDATIDKGSAFVSSGYFTDPGPGADTWTATVDYGDGTGIQQLALNADYSFELNHPFADIGVYTVLVNIADDKVGVGTDTVMVTVTATTVNIAPVVNAGPDVTITKGSTFFQIGSFTDPGPDADTWTATVDYGDGVVDPDLSLNPDNTFDLSHVYAATGLYTVTVTVRDDKGGTGSDSATIMVNDFAISGDYSADEGIPYTLSLISNGPGAATITGWNITWGDGPDQEVAGNPGSVTHLYADGPNTYGISATVTEGIVMYQTQGTVAVTVNNVAPIVDAGQDKTINEGSAFTQSGSFTDPGADTWTATVDYGDGSGIQPLALNADKTFDFRHIYTRGGDFTVTITVTDKDDGAGSDTVIVRVSSAALTVDAGADAVIDEGGSFTQSGSFTDVGTGPWTATVDYGDGSAIQPLIFTAEKTFVLSHTFSDNGEYMVIVTISDIGRTGSDTATVTVNNVAPTVDAGQDKTINEGSSFSQSGSFTDPGEDTWTATVDYGDGSGIQLLTIGTDRTFSLSHLYGISGIFTISVTVTDKDGGAGSDTVAVKVNGANANSAPVVNAGSDAAITRGSTFSQSGSFTDLDAADTWTATVNYGDGSGTRLLSLNADKTFSLSHVYTRNGVFTVSVAVTDKAGAKGSDTATVTVTTATNVAPVVNAGPDAAITRGSTFSQSGSFTDPDSADTWTATVNYGDGSGTRLLSLNADKTFSLSHVYTRNGVFTVSVAVTDKAGAKGFDTATVTVTTATNVAPVVNAGPDAAITKGSTFTQSGSFIDPDSTETWIANVSYGDGSGIQSLAYNADKIFALSHHYADVGVYTVAVNVTDNKGGVGTDTVIVTVTETTIAAQVQIVPQPLNIGRTGYFIAFVRLPAGYRAADVDAGSVFCENKQALKLIRVRLFPQMFAAIFSRQDLAVPTGNIKMTVRGTIEKNGAVVPFSGVTNVYVINKKVTTKEDTDSVMSMTDTQIFTKFNK